MAEVAAPFDEYLDTPNKSPRMDVPRRGVVLHHAALRDLAYLEYLAMGGKQVSATSIVKNRVSKEMMRDAFRAWSLSSAWGDSSFRSVETCNETIEGWTISDESHWELAYLVAYWAQRDGFWPHRDGPEETWTVVGHREMYTIHGVSYPTACPGGMDLNLVTSRAQQILLAAQAAGIDLTPIDNESEEDEMKPFGIKTEYPNGTRMWAVVAADLRTAVPAWVEESANALVKRFGIDGAFTDLDPVDFAEYMYSGGWQLNDKGEFVRIPA